METASSPWVAVSLFLSMASIVLAAIAYWRSGGEGGQTELQAVRTNQQLVLDELRRKIMSRLEDSLTRVARAERRLAELRIESASVVHHSIDALARELGEIKREAEVSLERLKAEVAAGAESAQEALSRRVHYIEGSIRVLIARAEIRSAERLADVGKFVQAEDLLEDAIAKVREAKMRLTDEGAEEPAFAPVIDTLHDAMRSVRARAADHKRQIDSVLSASDSLLASLRSHEEALA